MNGETQSHRLFAAFLQFLGLSVEFQPWNMIKGPLISIWRALKLASYIDMFMGEEKD